MRKKTTMTETSRDGPWTVSTTTIVYFFYRTNTDAARLPIFTTYTPDDGTGNLRVSAGTICASSVIITNNYKSIVCDIKQRTYFRRDVS